MQLAKPDLRIVFTAAFVIEKAKPSGAPALFCISILIFPGVHASLAAEGASMPQKTQQCPRLVRIVNGQVIRPGGFPLTVTNALGEKKVLVTAEMALTPLEFETAAGFKLRVPATALNINSSDCDERRRYRDVRINLYWVDNKILTLVELQQLRPSVGHYKGKHIDVFASFSQGYYPEHSPLKSYVEQDRQWFGPPHPLHEFGLIAYSRSGKKARTEKTWDAFVLSNLHDWTNVDITYSCEVSESELSSKKFKPEGNYCDGNVGIKKGFGIRVKFMKDLIPEASTITGQLIEVMKSYIVKE